MKRECAAVITNTGNSLVVPSSSGIRRGGNHRSHRAASPGANPLGQHRGGIAGARSNNARTRGSNTVNDVGPGLRSYLGGASEFTALITVFRETPNRAAIRAFGTPQQPAS
jgi:hypothetical protein